jgi:lipopolysaccharide/colanic/teichoic acid biosynthesis glycosyltransferase
MPPSADTAAPAPSTVPEGVAPVSSRQCGWPAGVKRAVDVVGALGLGILSAPLWLATAVAVRLDSPGPVLYRAERVGRDGRTFTEFKFRSMIHGGDDAIHRQAVVAAMQGRSDGGPTNALKFGHDPRVTRVGRVIRRWSIDELPQLLNVVRGEMSLVGPRPEVPYAVEHYQPWHHRRFAVTPGITGLWQVSGRSTLTQLEMLELDVRYADTWSLGADLRILVATVGLVARRVGAG